MSDILNKNSNSEVEVCDEYCIHADILRKALDKLPSEETLYDLAELFKVFGDSTRIRILCALFESEMCVCDIAELLNMTQSAVSHQLKVLKNAGLVKARRDGKTIFYSMSDEHVVHIFNDGLNHILEK